jgi:hypothetical protein
MFGCSDGFGEDRFARCEARRGERREAREEKREKREEKRKNWPAGCSDGRFGCGIRGPLGRGEVAGCGFFLGFWFLVSGFWFLVSGFWFLVSGYAHN